MVLNFIFKVLQYILTIAQDFVAIILNNEDVIKNCDGKIVTKLPGRRDQMYIFAKNFFKEPKVVASLFPSSHFLTDKVLAPVNWSTARLIVEYGPGIGNMSQEILRRMHPECKLVLFELNRDMAEFLQTAYTDPRMMAFERSATDVENVLQENGLGKADYVISGVPFSQIPVNIGKQIVEATKMVLKPEGKFLVYQFRPNVLELLEPLFENIEKDFEPVNIPPLRVYYAYNQIQKQST
ncbi:hypothetical protein HDE_11575 [Halotydeus destructor]|nr:hypothetical protein HDE_11575 [Halotydeus destructor]